VGVRVGCLDGCADHGDPLRFGRRGRSRR
jgi:hypothetical protein